jgi:hypothetical protein
LRSQIGFLFSTFLKGVIIQKTFYTQIVFSSIVAKVSTLAFSGISESFATAAKTPEEIPTNTFFGCSASKVVCFVFTYLYGSI